MVGANAAMLVHVRVSGTFIGTEAAGREACVEKGLDERGVGLCLSYYDMTCRGAHVGAVEIQADAVPQVGDHRLGQAGVGAGRAHLTASSQMARSLAQSFIVRCRLRMSGKHLL